MFFSSLFFSSLKRNYFQYLFALLFLLLFVNVTFAGHDPDSQQNEMGYFQTDDVYPLDKGELEILFTPAYMHSIDSYTINFPVEFEFGVTNRWQLMVEAETVKIFSPVMMPSVTGFGDLSIIAQYSLMRVRSLNNHVSFLMGIVFPTGDIHRDLTDGLLRFVPSFLFAHDTHFKNFIGQLFGEIALSLVDRIKRQRDPADDDPAAHQVTINIGYDVRFPRVNYSVEINWLNNRWNNGGTDNSLFITPGIIYLTKAGVELGLGIAIGLTHESDCFRILGQINYTFSLLG